MFLIYFLTYLFYKPDLSLYLDDFINKVSNTKQNVFLLNLSVLALIFIASIIIVGVPFMYIYLFYEGFSIGFTIGVFIYLKGTKKLPNLSAGQFSFYALNSDSGVLLIPFTLLSRYHLSPAVLRSYDTS